MASTGAADVLIIGAGPAGCAAGIVAARAGARVLVLDRAAFPRPKTCGDAVSNAGARIVDDLGMGHELLAEIPHARVTGAAAILPDAGRVERSFGSDHGFIVPRLHLDDLLRKLLERSGARLLEGVKVRRLIVEGDRVVGASTERDEHRAPITIAADGPGSLAWSVFGESYKRGRSLGVAITGYYADVDFGSAAGVSEHYFEPDLPCGYGWAFPPVEGLANVGVYQRSDHFERGRQKLGALLEAFLARHPERFAEARREGDARVWSLPLAVDARAPAGPGMLACGDAGRSVDPLSGEGIWQALHTGCLAGRHASAALDRGLDRRASRAYQRECTKTILIPSLLRLALQESMRVIVDRGLHRRSMVKRALAWGYSGDRTELSKRTA